MRIGMIMSNQNMSKKQNCYMDSDSFIVNITEDTYKDIAKDFETRFSTSNYEFKRPSPKRKNKVIGLMKDELEIMKKFLRLRAKT